MSTVFRQYVVFLLFCCPLVQVAQTFSYRTVTPPPTNKQINFLGKDDQNRLIAGSNEAIWAYDGHQWQSMTSNAFPTPILAFYRIPETAQQFILTTKAIYQVHADHKETTTDLFYSFPSEIKTFQFKGETLIVQDINEIVRFLSLKDKKTLELPYVGKPVEAIFIKDGEVFLVTDEILSWDKVNRSYRKRHRSLEPGKYHSGQTDSLIILVHSSGRVFEYQPKKNQFDRVSQIDQVVSDGLYFNDKLYFRRQSGGLLIYDISKRNAVILEDENGMCSDEVDAIYVNDERYIWTSTTQGLCLSQNRRPVLADRELGLDNNNISSIAEMENELYFTTNTGGFYLLNADDRLVRISGHSSLSPSTIRTMVSLKNQQLLIGTQNQGLYTYTRSSGFLPIDTVLLNTSITTLSSASTDQVYIGTKQNGLWNMTFPADSVIDVRRLFPNQIQSIVDIIGILNGDAIVADDQHLYFLHSQENTMEILLTMPNDKKIKDISLWNGWVYITTPQTVIRVPVAGKNEVPEYFDQSHGLPAAPFTSIHACKRGIFISGGTETFLFSENFFDNPKQFQSIKQYPYRIQKNGLVETGIQYVAATDHGVITMDENNIPPSPISIYFDQITINEKPQDPSDELHVDTDQNRWRFSVKTISPENTTTPEYKWKLIGDKNSLTGQNRHGLFFFPELKPGNYRFEVFAESANEKSPTISISFRIKPHFTSSRYFLPTCLLFALLFIGAFVLLLVKFLTNRQRQRIEELQKANDLLEIEHKSLQLQMNPHFLFNALNSIQGLIGHDNTKAKYYMAKLGKLMRHHLFHARNGWTTITDEVKLLETYLKLEQLHRAFEFTIDRINIEADIAIPSMMLQPLVENAVKHGASSQSEGAAIAITFKYDGRKIKCTVVNKRSIGQETKSESDHLGVSTKIINDRIEMYRKQGIIVSPLQLTSDEEWTKAEIGLPYKTIQ